MASFISTASTMAAPTCNLPIMPSIGGGGSAVRAIVIAPNGDFLIQLTPTAKPLAEATINGQPKHRRVVQFRVSRAVLQDSSALFRGRLSNVPTNFLNFENNGIGFALEVWLRAIHNGVDTLPDNLRATRIERAWVAIGVGEQFGFAPEHLDKIKPWFLDCYRYALDNGAGLTPMIARLLAFPCSVFDHAEGFMKLTKYLAYNTNGHIFTHNPSSFQHLSQDARVLDGPLSNARAQIQSILASELFFPLNKLHRATCDCRKVTAFDYQEVLMSLGCWPIDRAVEQNTLTEIFEKLSEFQFTPATHSCPSGACNRDFKKSVDIAILKAKDYFDGLCLDCTERSHPADDQPHEDYVAKNSPFKGCWDMDCRFGHGRPSWYFSWMGPSSTRRDICSKHRLETHQRVIERKNKRASKKASTIMITTNDATNNASEHGLKHSSDEMKKSGNGDPAKSTSGDEVNTSVDTVKSTSVNDPKSPSDATIKTASEDTITRTNGDAPNEDTAKAAESDETKSSKDNAGKSTNDDTIKIENDHTVKIGNYDTAQVTNEDVIKSSKSDMAKPTKGGGYKFEYTRRVRYVTREIFTPLPEPTDDRSISSGGVETSSSGEGSNSHTVSNKENADEFFDAEVASPEGDVADDEEEELEELDHEAINRITCELIFQTFDHQFVSQI